MASKSLLKAICLALILSFSIAPAAWTEPPGGMSPGTTPTNGGGEGHPWDDGTVEGDPGDTANVNQPVSVANGSTIIPVAALGVEPTGGLIIRGAILNLWRKLVGSEANIVRNSAKLKSLR